MKKPTLRFRQVFEHPTHFKVTKPLGNPLIIAKQGLSPSLTNRLRKFATDGEVPEPTEQDKQNLADLVASRSLEMESAPQFDARPPIETRPLRTEEEVQRSIDYIKNLGLGPEGTPVEVIKPGQIAQAPIEKLGPSEDITIRSTATPMPPERIIGLPEAQRMGPPAELARPVASSTVAEPISESPVAARPANDVVADLNQMISEEKAKAKPDADMIAQLESALAEQAKPGPVAPAAPPVVASAASKPPVAATSPVATQVTGPTAKPDQFVLPKDFDAGKPLTVEAYRAAKEANKGRSEQEVALGLIRQYAPNAEPPPDFDKLLTPPPEGASEDALKRFDLAKDDLARAIVNQAKVDYDTSKQLLAANERAQAQRLINAEKDRATADALGKRRAALEEAVKGGFQYEMFSGNLAAQIGSALSVAMGAFASGLTGMPNYALKIFEGAVERDLEAQKAKYNSLVNQYNRVLGDTDDAEKLARADLNDLAALQVEATKMESKVRGVGPAADQMIAELRAKATKEREEVALKMAEAREAKVKADMARELNDSLIKQRNAADKRANAAAGVAGASKPPAAGKELPNRGESGLDLFYRLNAIEQGKRIFNVKNPSTGKIIEIAASSVPAKTEAQNQLTYRQSALEQADRVLDLLKAKPNMLNVNEIKQVQSAITRFLTEYPASSGAKRILPRTDKDIVMNAVFDNPVPYARYSNLFDNTRVAMEEFKHSIKDGINQVVSYYGIEGHPGKVAFMHGANPSNMIRIRLKNGTQTDIPKENLESAKQRLGKMFDSVVE